MTSLESLARIAFAETCDPGAYVPRAATEAALAAIRNWGESDAVGSSIAALIGTPGLGKTQLLRVTESRVNEGVARFVAEGGSLAGVAPHARALYLPYAGLSLSDLAIWAHGLLGVRPAVTSDWQEPGVALEALERLGGGSSDPFFLIMDDADAMPAATIEALLDRLPRSDSPLRILVALNRDAKAARLLSALHPLQLTEIHFESRMSVEETSVYLRARMGYAGFPEVEIARIGEEEATWLHSLSLGVPRRLHELATARFEAREGATPGRFQERRSHERWMGRPIDDDFDV